MRLPPPLEDLQFILSLLHNRGKRTLVEVFALPLPREDGHRISPWPKVNVAPIEAPKGAVESGSLRGLADASSLGTLSDRPTINRIVAEPTTSQKLPMVSFQLDEFF